MATQTCPEDQVEMRIQQAVQYKAEGNQHYKQKRLREAISRYHWALMHLRGLDPSEPTPLQAFGGEKAQLSPEQVERLHSTECDCYNNLAACLLLSEKVNYERVRDYCLKVLDRQAANTKALYRAGVALYNIGDYDRALHYLTEAAKLCPNDAHVKRYIQETEQRLSQYHQRERMMYKGMFAK
ncbi:tetratricopeptide repeat protein 9C-like isoform X1 [Carcharodon carcharias]|uniref:tetratricopeptide repeat protein 9C-like isoform X1 n=2 Tax=Carcharodon carcharias TaxID=13397 RepID=UPI001B7DAEF6|nr:tetratricopeptide repeat protein 9C-like isoform X1 [Carcharodon carcharias]